jgi:hypothetical protein
MGSKMKYFNKLIKIAEKQLVGDIDISKHKGIVEYESVAEYLLKESAENCASQKFMWRIDFYPWSIYERGYTGLGSTVEEAAEVLLEIFFADFPRSIKDGN